MKVPALVTAEREKEREREREREGGELNRELERGREHTQHPRTHTWNQPESGPSQVRGEPHRGRAVHVIEDRKGHARGYPREQDEAQGTPPLQQAFVEPPRGPKSAVHTVPGQRPPEPEAHTGAYHTRGENHREADPDLQTEKANALLRVD